MGGTGTQVTKELDTGVLVNSIALPTGGPAVHAGPACFEFPMLALPAEPACCACWACLVQKCHCMLCLLSQPAVHAGPACVRISMHALPAELASVHVLPDESASLLASGSLTALLASAGSLPCMHLALYTRQPSCFVCFACSQQLGLRWCLFNGIKRLPVTLLGMCQQPDFAA